MSRSDPCSADCTGVHSYTSDGMRWCWQDADPKHNAIDAEIIEVPPPALKKRHTGPECFWRAWTRLEVVAKLTNVPAALLVASGGLQTLAVPHVVVAHQIWRDTQLAVGTIVGSGDQEDSSDSIAYSRFSIVDNENKEY